VLVYTFFGMQTLSCLAVIAIMAQKTVTLQKIKPKFGSLYGGLGYENNWLVRFYPIWFMAKRIAFVVMVFYLESTFLMLTTLQHIYLVELFALLT